MVGDTQVVLETYQPKHIPIDIFNLGNHGHKWRIVVKITTPLDILTLIASGLWPYSTLGQCLPTACHCTAHLHAIEMGNG